MKQNEVNEHTGKSKDSKQKMKDGKTTDCSGGYSRGSQNPGNNLITKERNYSC
jgi:hypothetical protein